MIERVRRPLATGLIALATLAAAACSDDGDDAAPSPAPTTIGQADAGEVTAEGISDARCEQNRAAGTMTFLSSFDFAAAASIIDVVVADEKGYFSDMCLTVELRPSFSTANYPLVASGQAQMSSAGSFTELVNNATGGAELVAVADFGKTPIEALIVPDDAAITDLEGLRGKTIGVKGDLPPSIVAMLNEAGLQRGSDYSEVLLDGFDPQAHLASAIDALPVYKSNEPGQLDAAGVGYTLFDPSELDVPGSFGVLYTSRAFLDEHPTAVQDFVRASFRGYQDAVDDPEGAVSISVARIDAAGNQNFLTTEGETFRWRQESAVVQQGTPAGAPVGLIDPTLLEAEVAAYAEAGVFEAAPDITALIDPEVAAGTYDEGGTLIWPAG